MLYARVKVLISLVTIGCAASLPPAPPVVRTATQVHASVAQTWEAAVEAFADRNIPIKTLDRASGLIVAEAQSVSARQEGLADCGTVWGSPLTPDRATWNLLVRGDSTHSTVKATVRFTLTVGQSTEECGTKGRWETAFEQKLKTAAEAKAAQAGAPRR